MRKIKKTLLAATATLALSSAFTTTASAHTVKSGDSLWGIAQKYNTSVSELRSLNNISGSLIFPGQYIKTDGSSSSSNNSSNVSTSTSSSSSVAYTVRSGDTLWGIARKYGVSVSNLKDRNNLSSDLIRVGQRLSVKGASSSSSSSSNVSSSARTTKVKAQTVNYSSNSSIVDEARKHIGTRYVWGGTSPSGFDCSGFIYYVLNQSGVNVPRTNAAGYYNMSTKISNPQPGDLVFFSNTYKPGISHMGIYIGGGQMIQAGSSGVKVSNVHSSYWGKFFTGYGRL